ncbi:glycosyltransferase [Methylocaldum sp. MU1018]
MSRLTILICTHNRAELLERVLDSLNAALRPPGWSIDILVAANACTDRTHDLLKSIGERQAGARTLPVAWFAEPVPGKSHALNSAIPRLKSDLVALIDDDHRVDASFLTGICAAAEAYPEATMFCGRILPDWNGSEPEWVHDTGPYAVYPLPIPCQDQGDTPHRITLEGKLPGGGNLIVNRGVFARVGGFSAELGPRGHDLGGGEDVEFVIRALQAGERMQYVPSVVQYHYVDLKRFNLFYLLRKSYQRSYSATLAGNDIEPKIPRYIWRKLLTYLVSAVFSLSWKRTRFYMMRLSATLGEMQAFQAFSKPQHSTKS